MANLTTAFKRAVLRELMQLTEDNSTPLSKELQAFSRARIKTTSAGQIVASRSANGHSVTFSTASNSQGVTPSSLTELSDELQTLYETVDASLISAGYATPTDAQRFAEMMHRLQPVRSYKSSYLSLRHAC